MRLGPNDLHALVNPKAGRLAVYRPSGEQMLTVAASNQTTAPWWYGHLGRCPPGLFKAGTPRDECSPPYGLHFTPLLDLSPLGVMSRWRRAGIGIHGGGSGLADPYAPEQRLVPTHGCIRVHNRDNAAWVHVVRAAQTAGGVVYVTVLPGLEPA